MVASSPGGPADDFARLLVNCCDGEYRRKHEYELLEQYYEDLCSLLEEKGKKPPFTKEEVRVVRCDSGVQIYVISAISLY